jgi:hypothetical protein
LSSPEEKYIGTNPHRSIVADLKSDLIRFDRTSQLRWIRMDPHNSCCFQLISSSKAGKEPMHPQITVLQSSGENWLF